MMRLRPRVNPVMGFFKVKKKNPETPLKVLHIVAAVLEFQTIITSGFLSLIHMF